MDTKNLTIKEAMKRLNDKEKWLLIKVFEGRAQIESGRRDWHFTKAQVSRLERLAIETYQRDL